MARLLPLTAMLPAFLLTIHGVLADGSASMLLHDARAVHDVALLQREPEVPGRTWVVLRIVPGDDSGAALVTGAIMVLGKWQRIAITNEPAVPERGSYEWTERQKAHQRAPQPSDFYSPFKSGGVVICGYRAAAEGEARFAPVFLLPDGWESAAATLAEAWNRPAGPPSPRQLVTAAASADPFVAVMAYHQLLESGNIEPALLRMGLTDRDRMRGAAIAYLALTASSGEQRGSILAVLETTIRNARSKSQWDPAALGAFAAKLFADHRANGDEPARMLRLIKEQVGVTGGTTDVLVAEILKVLGL